MIKFILVKVFGFHFHSWVQWATVKANVKHPITQDKIEFKCAYRYCKTCNKFEVKPG